ncbi:unnamed protein product [Diamesa tonsa]
MEQETFFSKQSEKQNFAKNYKKYGTTTNHLKRNSNTEVLIKHNLCKNETLQGIALKYGCSMEHIRRANRLFANDSLFLREHLMIPVNTDSPFYPKESAERPHVFPQRANTIAETPSSKDMSPNDESPDSLASPDEEHRKYMEEFLDKIDSSIASSKKLVQQQQKNSGFISSHSDDNLFNGNACYGNGNGNSFTNHNYDLAHSSTSNSNSSSSYQQYYQTPANNHQSARHSLGTGNDSTQLIVMTQGRHVKNSLQRLEKQQDEIFEL